MDDRAVLGRLEERGIQLPPAPQPVASYVPVIESGALAFVAGQVPMIDGQLLHPGRLGSSVAVGDGQEAAARAALQAVAALRDHLGGSFGRLSRILQITVYVASEADFVEHSTVANGASDLLIDLFGADGRHARAAVGMASLPLGSCVEVAMTAEVAASQN